MPKPSVSCILMSHLPGYCLPEQKLQGCASAALSRLACCDLCPRCCGVDRLSGQRGFCRTGRYAGVASYAPHFGEEDCLVGSAGSGTIFFSGCNLSCLFCQNYDISQQSAGRAVSAEELSRMMLALQDCGCHNINFVTPTHVVPQILEALALAREDGLHLPLVYNCGGYDSVDTLRRWTASSISTCPMPNTARRAGFKYSGAPDYVERMKAALKEMHRQVGDLVLDEAGIARRGLLVRHLVLPEGMAGTEEVVRFLSQEISENTYLNVMAQYHPAYHASRFPELCRPISAREYARALALAAEAGLTRGLAML